MPPPLNSWSSDTVYALVRVCDLKLWGRSGWVDALAQARTYLTWDLADRARERIPSLELIVPVAVSLRVVDDSYKRVDAERASYSATRQRPLF